MEIQICFVVDQKTQLLALQLEDKSILENALQRLPELGIPTWASLQQRGYGVSVFGKKKLPQDYLSEGDRVEICAPLIATPMDARRRRAKREHKGGKM
ncbi:RnfH family protein [Undibacterium cyanobacteriorum]|uniref:RnfH family protein n=1 Tax=Undibacterium cyanobacteriorum TaxID=3073561 RepID=A0ABY9RCF0_9BURK|nr:RnfH family protein [Undibacterium sp. 20NA77.5]WMW78937.1 RnfH family protein [Undibacterium sp. 20NA77.5]